MREKGRSTERGDGALTSAIVLAGQAIGWPEAASVRGVEPHGPARADAELADYTSVV
jgi:hypothetical protein